MLFILHHKCCLHRCGACHQMLRLPCAQNVYASAPSSVPFLGPNLLHYLIRCCLDSGWSACRQAFLIKLVPSAILSYDSLIRLSLYNARAVQCNASYLRLHDCHNMSQAAKDTLHQTRMQSPAALHMPCFCLVISKVRSGEKSNNFIHTAT